MWSTTLRIVLFLSGVLTAALPAGAQEMTTAQKRPEMIAASAALPIAVAVEPDAAQIAESIAREQLEIRIADLEIFSRSFPQEKVYLHFDNTSYRQGDDIWFAAYVVSPTDGRSTAPSYLSKTLYVELLTPGGEVIDRRVLRVENGRCHGDFKLDRIPFYSGFYEVRAYTKYMLDFGEQTVFSRLLPVYDRPKEPGNRADRRMLDHRYLETAYNYPMLREKPERGSGVNVRFFPEGGGLVQGVTSRVAFEATDKNGNPIEVTGIVLGAGSDGVSSAGGAGGAGGSGGSTFATTHEGRGVFTHTPETTADPKTTPKPARVEVTHEGKTHRFELPAATPQGVVMAVDNVSDPRNIAVSLQRGPATPPTTLGVAVLSGGRLQNAMIATLEDAEMLFAIDKTTLPAGVTQVVLFDPEGAVVADRLVFIPPKPSDVISIEATPSKRSYLPHERIEIDFAVRDHLGRPVQAPFSLAVRDATDEVAARGNALTDLLLMSEIKGYVRRPQYYFEAPGDPVRASHLDELLMVNGWRRYRWTHMTGTEALDHEYLPEQGIEVSGRVVGLKFFSGKERRKPNVDISLFLKKVREKGASGASEGPGGSGGSGSSGGSGASEGSGDSGGSEGSGADSTTLASAPPTVATVDKVAPPSTAIAKAAATPATSPTAPAVSDSSRIFSFRPDSLGQFSMTANVSGRWNMVFGVTENGKKRDYKTVLDRTFSPPPRRYNYAELRAEFAEPAPEPDPATEADITAEEAAYLAANDSVQNPTLKTYLDSVLKTTKYRDAHQIEAVTVKAKRSFYERRNENARKKSDTFYDMQQTMDELYDSGDHDENMYKLVNGEVRFLPNKPVFFILDYRPIKVVVATEGVANRIVAVHSSIDNPPIDFGAVKHMYVNTDPAVISQYLIVPALPFPRTIFDVASFISSVVFCESYPKGEAPVHSVRGVRKTYLEGYNEATRAFSGPDYDVLPPDGEDYRRTLYWNPEVAPDSLGQTRVNFNNNSRAGRIAVSAETAIPSGQVGVSTQIK